MVSFRFCYDYPYARIYEYSYWFESIRKGKRGRGEGKSFVLSEACIFLSASVAVVPVVEEEVWKGFELWLLILLEGSFKPILLLLLFIVQQSIPL